MAAGSFSPTTKGCRGKKKWDFPLATKKMIDAVNKEVEEEHKNLKLPKLTKKATKIIEKALTSIM